MRKAGASFLVAVLATVMAACTRDLPVDPSPVAVLASVQGPDLEPNNTCSDAQDFGAVALPFTLNGSLDGFPLPSGDVDFLRFTGTPNTAVRVDLEGQGTGQGTLGDPFLGAFDSGCNLIALNDDGGGNLNSRLVITIPADGILVLGVTICCDAGFTEGGSGTYLLSVQEFVSGPPVASFGFFPSDPSVFDIVQFFDFSFDPDGLGIQSQQWQFDDGTTGTGCCPTHQYAADGDYPVHLTVTTIDGRTGSTTQTVSVRTHDVAITKLAAPTSASAGQNKAIVVGIKNKRYPETVEVQLFKGVPGGFQFVGAVTQAVPLSSGNSTTGFNFTYTFTPDDASIGKVTFKAVANLVGARDALPGDNEAIAPLTRVSAGQALRGAIAFHSTRDGDFDIYVMNTDGTNVTNVTNSTDQELDEIWSPDGSRLAFAKCAGTCDVFFTEIFVINPNGSGLKQLTHGGGFLGAWSPDGKRIAFVRDGVGILIMNADGTGVTPTNQNGRPTAWSPNGRQILFQSDRDGDNDFYLMNVDGSGVIQLTNDPASDEGDFAGWSPDGRRIVFSSRRDGGDLDIFTMKPDGSGVTQITRNDFIEDDDPVWAPDGKHIAFHSTRPGTEEIFIMNADGSDPIQLTFNSHSAVPAWRAKSLP